MVRVLHVVTLSADGRELLLGASPDGRPTHSIVLDERLLRAVRGEDPGGSGGAELQLSPREIQARLRGGASVEEVAAEAGVAVARIERYAGPVRSERAQILSDAQASFLLRPRSGRSSRPLAEAVAANLATITFARPETESWSVVREDDGTWTLTLRVVVRGRQRAARWRWSPTRRELSALDGYATQLGFVDGDAPLPVPRSTGTSHPEAPTAPRRRPPAKRAHGKAPAKEKPVKRVPATKRAKKTATKVSAKEAGAPVRKATRPRTS